MTEIRPAQRSQEIELKLALPGQDIRELTRKLKNAPPMVGQRARKQSLLNTYFDTPDQKLHQMQIALRVRQIASGKGHVWLQTLKTNGGGDSALSKRGEWEVAIGSSGLSVDALANTPWQDIDPDGSLFLELAPCFTTRFERTSWEVQDERGSVIAVSLDIGQIEAGERHAPICELELELLSGIPASLFDVAGNISQIVAVIPASQSKSERGHALALGTTDMPQHSRPPRLAAVQAADEAATLVLREVFSQFTQNLELILVTDNPEVVHQARVGWRRLKTALRFFSPLLQAAPMPDLSPMRPMLTAMGYLRDLDVMMAGTLPTIERPYVAADEARQIIWGHFEAVLVKAAQAARTEVRQAIRDPAVGSALLAMTRFIEDRAEADEKESGRESAPVGVKPWAERRVEKLREKLKLALKNCVDADDRHRARILAKRLRYSIEAMQTVLPKQRARRWLKRATSIQNEIGTSRDLQRSIRIADDLGADPGLLEFLRGFGLGTEQGQDRLRF